MKGLRRYLIASAILLVGYLLAQYFRPVPTDWKATYLKEDKIPFGTYVLYQQHANIFPKAEMLVTNRRLYNNLKGKSFRNTNLLLLGTAVDLDKNDLQQLLHFVRAGNAVLIASFDRSTHLEKYFSIASSSSFEYARKKSIAINFTNPMLQRAKGYVFDKGLGDQFFSKFDSVKAVVLGKNAEGKANFLQYPIGKGAVYFLPNPQLLTNYNLLNPAGADYAAKVLSYLPPAKTFIWDEFNTRAYEEDTSVLRVIFGNQMLRWGYYLALFSLVAFVLYEMKRRQRIIPIIEPLSNSSVDFVKVVGKVYYQQRDNQDIAHKKMNYLLEHIRSTYQLKTAELDAELEAKLAQRSGVSEETISAVFQLMRQLRAGAFVDDQMLISFNKLTEQFYQQSQ